MEQKIGYSLIDLNNNILQSWLGEIPNLIILPNGNQVFCAQKGKYSNYSIVEKWQVSNTDPGLVITGETTKFDGTKVIETLEYRSLSTQELLSYSASSRYNKEIGGISVSNNSIFTDRQSQSMIVGIITLMTMNPNTTINFKTGQGFIKANLSVMNTIANSVATHVQTCFDTESDLSNQIKDNSIKLYSQIDNVYSNINTRYN